MNFVSGGIGQEQVELKYCERCGGLFLRIPGSSVVQCGRCATRLAADTDLEGMTVRRQKRTHHPARLSRGPRLVERELQGRARIEHLRGVATAEAGS